MTPFLVSAVALTGCGDADPADVLAPVAIERNVAVPASASAGRPRVVVLGDSLTAGLGLPTDESYPAHLQRLADAAGYDVEFVARGVSGDTTAGGRSRLEWVLDEETASDVRMVVVALGGNDALRGLPIEQMRDNLDTIIREIQARGVDVVLAGMEAPPNFGPDYTSQFRGVFETLASTYDVVFVPFLLEGVAGVVELNQDDGIHPNAAGARRVAEHLWPTIEPVVASFARDEAASAP